MQDRIEVQRPAAVVIESAMVPIRIPAVSAVPGVDEIEAATDSARGLRVASADPFEEAGDGQWEQVPVVGTGNAAERMPEPVLQSRLLVAAQSMPGVVLCEMQGERDRRCLHHRLAPGAGIPDFRPRVDVIRPRGPGRSEECRVGKECVSTCRSRWSPYH